MAVGGLDQCRGRQYDTIVTIQVLDQSEGRQYDTIVMIMNMGLSAKTGGLYLNRSN